MSPELDNQLVSNYPLLFKNRNASEEDSNMGEGFNCGDGWFNILNTLCSCIMDPYNAAIRELERAQKYMGKDEQWTAERLETAKQNVEIEKGKVPVVAQVKEKFGLLRFYVDNSNERVELLIDFAERMTATTCELCGAPGKLSGRGWIRTLCEKDALQLYGEEMQKKIEKGLD